MIDNIISSVSSSDCWTSSLRNIKKGGGGVLWVVFGNNKKCQVYKKKHGVHKAIVQIEFVILDFIYLLIFFFFCIRIEEFNQIVI